MNEKVYFEIPARSEVYQVTPDCCSIVVKYGEPYEVQYVMDDSPHPIKSYMLQCYSCDPQLVIIPVAKQVYEEKYEFVKKKQQERNNQHPDC